MEKTAKLQRFRYSDFFDDGPPTRELMHRYLGIYSCSSVLETLAELSFLRGCANLMQQDRRLSQRIWHLLVRTCFLPGLRKTIGDDGDLIFTRPNLLFAAREALRACGDGGLDPRRELNFGNISRVLIAAIDLLRPAAETNDDHFAAATANNMFAGTGIKNRVVRSIIMMDALLRRYRAIASTDPDEKFRKIVGLTISEYRNLCLSTCVSIVLDSYTLVDTLANDMNPERLHSDVPIARLIHAGYKIEHIDSFLSNVSHEPGAFRMALRADTAPLDLTIFRDRPVVKTAEKHFVIIDSSFLLDKIEKGPFFALLNDSDHNDRQAMFRLCGPAFEDYVLWLLTNSINRRKDSLIVSPRFATNNENEEICDFAVCSDTAIALLECKGCFFKGIALESINPQELISEVDKKLAGTSDVRQGATQLARSIQRLYSKGTTDDTAHQRLKHATAVYPVLVVRDEIADTFSINQRLQESFNEFLGKTQLTTTVHPLVCLSIGALQDIAALLPTRSLCEIVAVRIQYDPELMYPPRALFSKIFPGFGQPAPCVSEKFDTMAAPLFNSLAQV